MILKIKELAVVHRSFFVLLSASISSFLTNLILKYLLNDHEYGQYAVLITFVSIIFSMGVVGLDQAMLRMSRFVHNNFEISFLLIRYMLIALIISSILYASWFNFKYNYDISTTIVLAIAIQILVIGYHVFRLKKNFFEAQFMTNSWKILFLVIIGLCYFLDLDVSFQYFRNILIILLVSLSVYSLSKLINIQFVNIKIEKKEIHQYSVNFFISLLLVTFLSFGERLIIEDRIGIEALGEYFFYSTVVLFPFSLLQGYIGFKELPAFKEHVTASIFKAKIKKVFILSLIMAIFIFLLISIINFIGFKKVDITNYQMVLVLCGIGLIKMIYGVLSAFIGARGRVESIKKINIYFSIASSFLVFQIYFFDIANIYLIIVLFGLLWSFRLFLFYKESKIVLSTHI